jgi:hypothetical protein
MTRLQAGSIAAASILLALLVRVGWVRLRAKRARTWPKISATIHSAKMEVMKLNDTTDIMLPCFAFSYVAAGANYSGRFSLFTDGEEEGKSVTRKMIGREFVIQYDPKRPSTWYIPDKKIEGFEVEQKMSPHLLEKLYPSD